MFVKNLIKPFFISLSILVKISVKLSREKKIKVINLEEGSIVLDLLRKLKLKPDTVIVSDNNMPIPDDDILQDKQNLSILIVSSGG